MRQGYTLTFVFRHVRLHPSKRTSLRNSFTKFYVAWLDAYRLRVFRWVLAALEDRRLRAAVLWDWYSHTTLQSRLRAALYKLRRAGPQKVVHKLLARVWPAAHRSNAAVSETPDSLAQVVQQVPSREEYTGRHRLHPGTRC